MKSTSKHILQKLLVNDFKCNLFKPFLLVADRFKVSKYNYLNASLYARLKAAVNKIFADKIVCNGPLKGLKFDREATLSGSTYTMLLGSFQSEIHPFIYAARQKHYDDVYNVGCADGYYAVGFARSISGSTIYAFDSDKLAIIKSQKQASQNGCQNNITFFGTFYPENLKRVFTKNKSLLIVDCEGVEKIHLQKKKCLNSLMLILS